MKTIPIKIIDGVNHPEKPLPGNVLAIVCDGVAYTVYEHGDRLPISEQTALDRDGRPAGRNLPSPL